MKDLERQIPGKVPDPVSSRTLREILATLSLDLTGLRAITQELDETIHQLYGANALQVQQIDFVHQYLKDLALVTDRLTHCVPADTLVDTAMILEAVTLDDLRRHILGTDCAQSASLRKSGDVNLF